MFYISQSIYYPVSKNGIESTLNMCQANKHYFLSIWLAKRHINCHRQVYGTCKENRCGEMDDVKFVLWVRAGLCVGVHFTFLMIQGDGRWNGNSTHRSIMPACYVLYWTALPLDSATPERTRSFREGGFRTSHGTHRLKRCQLNTIKSSNKLSE